jgi:hypothetical protein
VLPRVACSAKTGVLQAVRASEVGTSGQIVSKSNSGKEATVGFEPA